MHIQGHCRVRSDVDTLFCFLYLVSLSFKLPVLHPISSHMHKSSHSHTPTRLQAISGHDPPPEASAWTKWPWNLIKKRVNEKTVEKPLDFTLSRAINRKYRNTHTHTRTNSTPQHTAVISKGFWPSEAICLVLLCWSQLSACRWVSEHVVWRYLMPTQN